MKKVKFILPLIVLFFAVAGVFAMQANSKVNNTYATTLYFHYVPNTMSDAQYTTATNWEETTIGNADCNSQDDITCLVKVADSDLAPYSGTQEQKFASFLSDQSSASTYVDLNLEGTKSAQ